MNYKKYIQSDEWKAKRQAKLEDCQYKCECEGGCTREATQIHHLHYDTLGHETMDDLQALCPKCHMKISKVRNFYGSTTYSCCLKEDEIEVEKTLPYDIWNEANFRLQMDRFKYQVIAKKLGTTDVIAALLDKLGIMFACGDISVEPKTTKAIEQFVDVVPAKEAGLEGCCEIAYKIKHEFEKYFEVSEEELEEARALEETRMQEILENL